MSRTWTPAIAAGTIAVAIVGCSGSSDPSAVEPASDATTEPSTSVRATTTSTAAEIVERPEWGDVFERAGAVGTFVLHEIGSDEIGVWNLDRANTRKLPASTFKILNSMIILETGVIEDVDTVVPWDGVVREFDDWNRDHSLRSGIAVSAVWLYQVLARRVGATRMADWVDVADYGNGRTGGEIDDFWLRGDIRISPLEQVEFLGRMVSGDLPFRPEVVAAVEEIIVRERAEGWTWSHKTGTALAEDPVLGWLVGTTEFDGRSWVFAMNLDLVGLNRLDGQIDPQVRQQITRQILASEGALPPPT